MNSSTIVQKLWNYCNVLRDDRPGLLKRDGGELFVHYRHTLEKLGTA